jgi:hypothetical protein
MHALCHDSEVGIAAKVMHVSTVIEPPLMQQYSAWHTVWYKPKSGLGPTVQLLLLS